MKNVLAGVGVGAVIGMLVAPRKGSEIRRELQERLDRAGSGTRESDVDPKSILSVINTATREHLLSVYGLGPVIADQIIQNRPYESEEQLTSRNVVPESNFAHLRRQLQKRSA